jgi:mannose-1-phosphate guanylyltransferase
MSDSSRNYACIMAGGSGERFWPMSRTSVPKHLLKLFSGRTLLEETVRRIEGVVPKENIFVLTNEVQLAGSRAALEGVVPAEQIIAEPAKRDTAPAAALATALVRARAGDAATLAMLPADAFIADRETFRTQLGVAMADAATRDSLITFGVRPTYPATGFGYLEVGPESGRHLGAFPIRKVMRFVEKPDLTTAERYLKDGIYVWNAGIFVWKVATFLKEADRSAPELAAFVREFPQSEWNDFLAQRFPLLHKISVDYAIMEKSVCVETLMAKFDWDDVGLWTALPKHLPADAAGNTVRGTVVAEGATNNIAVSNGRVIALCGVKDLVVVETADAVLVCHRDAVQDIKKLTGKLPKELLQ